MKDVVRKAAASLIGFCALVSVQPAGPSFVDITWMSISNIQRAFFGGGGGRATTRQPFKPDVDAVRRVLTALGGPASVNLLLTGHSHFDHENSASADDLQVPIVVGGANYGAPLENLRSALKAEGLESVDLWIGSRRLPVAQLVVPVLKPKASCRFTGTGRGERSKQVCRSRFPIRPWTFLQKSGVQVIKPLQYMDRWRLDRNGIRSVPNATVKKALGF